MDELCSRDVFPDLPTWLRHALWRDGIRTRGALATLRDTRVRLVGKKGAALIAAWQANATDLCPHCQGTGRVPKEPT